jgi:hypothetical protein
MIKWFLWWVNQSIRIDLTQAIGLVAIGFFMTAVVGFHPIGVFSGLFLGHCIGNVIGTFILRKQQKSVDKDDEES